MKNFLTGRPWRRKRREILEQFHHECQHCKARGKYEKAVLVHHDKPRVDFPELAMADKWEDSLGRKHQNLIPLCFDCHEDEERRRGNRPQIFDREPVTDERW